MVECSTAHPGSDGLRSPLVRRSAAALPEAERWNHNIHYHPVLLALGPAARVLDVGCGDGMLARRFAPLANEVVGIDLDEASIAAARSATLDDNVTYVLGDIMDHPFEPGSFDLVVSVAALHHLDAGAGLRRLAELTRPGGHIGIVGLARSRFPHDVGRQIAAAVATRTHRHVLAKTYWEHSAPTVWPPPVTYAEMRAIAAEELPGSILRRRLLWRYTLTWQRPAPDPGAGSDHRAPDA